MSTYTYESWVRDTLVKALEASAAGHPNANELAQDALDALDAAERVDFDEDVIGRVAS